MTDVQNQVPLGTGRGAREMNHVGFVDFIVGEEASDEIDVTVNFRDAEASEMIERFVPCTIAIFSDRNGTLEGDTPIDSVQTGTLLASVTAGKVIQALSDSTGQLVVRLTDAGADTFYMGVLVGDELIYSPAVEFAA